MEKKKVALVILDGWGHGAENENNAIHQADTSFISSLYHKHPNAELLTHGENVGLPEGQMGNSEVGHLNIGAGRVVYQDLVRINKACEDGSLESNATLVEAIEYAKSKQKAVHLMGLVSEGGVHSAQNHLHALVDILDKNGLSTFIHAFTDGRDTRPEMAKKYIANLLEHISGKSAKLASIIGRYYAMDRDKRWKRIKKAYDLLVNAVGIQSEDALKAIQKSYDNEITDEFIEPIGLLENGRVIAKIAEGDVVICFNFRTDRCRQITTVLTQEDYPEHQMKKLNLHYVTMTRYDEDFKNVRVVFEKENIKNTLGEIISNTGASQLRTAETEKYPHVTFFFSGGRESPFEGESRIMVNSPKVATYDLMPEMSANELTNRLLDHLNSDEPDFICLNYANPDMVGHTGNFEAIVKAIETVDTQCKRLVSELQGRNYEIIIIADHGNADLARNPDGSPNTAHSTNPVPIIYIGSTFNSIKNGILADVAPSILNIMGISASREMTGKSLFN